MAPLPGDHGAADLEAENLRALLTFSRDSLRIPDKLTGEIGGGKALVVGQSGGKAMFWPLEVRRDCDGAFLGRRWPDFADACGAGEGWFLVLRHRGRLVTVKAFNGIDYLTELDSPLQYLPQVFCEAIGIRKLSNVMLKTSMSSTRPARVVPYKHRSHHVVGPGWKRFCLDNRIKVGDFCTTTSLF